MGNVPGKFTCKNSRAEFNLVQEATSSSVLHVMMMMICMEVLHYNHIVKLCIRAGTYHAILSGRVRGIHGVCGSCSPENVGEEDYNVVMMCTG